MKKLSLLLIVAGTVLGCQTAERPKTTEPEVKTDTTTKTAEPAKTELVIPDEIKTEGYAFYGLDRKEPVKVELIQPGQDKKTGELSFELKEVKNGKLYFNQIYGGQISENFGATSELYADKSGIYGTAMLGKPIDEPQLEMPANVSSGKSWAMGKPLKTDSFTIDSMTNKIAGIESVTVPLGKFDALKMVSTAKLTQGTTKTSATLTAWMVKGIGMVKLIIKTVDAQGKSQQQEMRAVK
ncbi:MAG: hypothetical protein ABL949_08385 [Fimbriimonadaceae bacterium]